MTANATDQLLDSAFDAYESGRLEEAERLGEELRVREPHNIAALHLLGVIAGQTGRADRGIELLQQAVALDPHSADLRGDFAHLLKQAGRLDEAIAAGEHAVMLNPQSVAAQNSLGQSYLAANRPNEALASFERVVALSPDLPLGHYNLGVALQSLNRDAEAMASFRRAIALAPSLAEAHARLGNMLYVTGNRAEALAHFRQAAGAQPESALGLMCRASILVEEAKGDEAERCLRRALALDPRNSEALTLLGESLAGSGRFTEAIATFEQAYRIEPRRTRAYAGIFGAKKIGEADRPLIERMLALLDSGNLPVRDRANLHFALGKAFDDLADYAAAMRHFDEANRIEAGRLRVAGRVLNRAQHAANIGAMMAAFTPDFFARHASLGSSSELPVLIVGMPRSGTTLVEQIISSHPQVGAGDELTFWDDQTATLTATNAASLASPTLVHRLADEYLAVLRGIDPAARRVTDKMPQNFLHLGLVHLVFPKARIIHCRRNPIDTSLSIYFTHFSMMRDFAFERSGIVFYYEQYLRLMAHWRQVLPAECFLEVDYEELVADRERMSRQMIEFCGLDWDEACLHHEANGRVVKTASMWQARQPLYRTSVERWRRYEPWLGEFRRLVPEAGGPL